MPNTSSCTIFQSLYCSRYPSTLPGRHLFIHCWKTIQILPLSWSIVFIFKGRKHFLTPDMAYQKKIMMKCYVLGRLSGKIQSSQDHIPNKNAPWCDPTCTASYHYQIKTVLSGTMSCIWCLQPLIHTFTDRDHPNLCSFLFILGTGIHH